MWMYIALFTCAFLYDMCLTSYYIATVERDVKKAVVLCALCEPLRWFGLLVVASGSEPGSFEQITRAIVVSVAYILSAYITVKYLNKKKNTDAKDHTEVLG